MLISRAIQAQNPIPRGSDKEKAVVAED